MNNVDTGLISIAFPSANPIVERRQGDSYTKASNFGLPHELGKPSLVAKDTYGYVVETSVHYSLRSSAATYGGRIIDFQEMTGQRVDPQGIEQANKDSKSKDQGRLHSASPKAKASASEYRATNKKTKAVPIKEGTWIRLESAIPAYKLEMAGTMPIGSSKGVLREGRYYVMGIDETNGVATLSEKDTIGASVLYNIDLDLFSEMGDSASGMGVKATPGQAITGSGPATPDPDRAKARKKVKGVAQESEEPRFFEEGACSKCGTDIKKGNHYCPSCGTKVEGAVAGIIGPTMRERGDRHGMGKKGMKGYESFQPEEDDSDTVIIKDGDGYKALECRKGKGKVKRKREGGGIMGAMAGATQTPYREHHVTEDSSHARGLKIIQHMKTIDSHSSSSDISESRKEESGNAQVPAKSVLENALVVSGKSQHTPELQFRLDSMSAAVAAGGLGKMSVTESQERAIGDAQLTNVMGVAPKPVEEDPDEKTEDGTPGDFEHSSGVADLLRERGYANPEEVAKAWAEGVPAEEFIALTGGSVQDAKRLKWELDQRYHKK